MCDETPENDITQSNASDDALVDAETTVRADFKEADALRALLWCNRHCCVCGKQCGVGIELAHIGRRDDGEIDNCIPACFECHMMIGHYRDDHSRGKKFKAKELKKRRDQVYEQQTKHLVPPVKFLIWTYPGDTKRAHFSAENLSEYPPVKVTLRFEILVDGNKKGTVCDNSPHYQGNFPINLNPRMGFRGWFEMPLEEGDENRRISVIVIAILTDIYDRPHSLLPFGYVKMPNAEWYYEPAPEGLIPIWKKLASGSDL